MTKNGLELRPRHRHLRSISAKVETEDIDFSSFRTSRCPLMALRCLRSMNNIENHTVCYLRDILVNQAHKVRDVTSFPHLLELRGVLAR